MAIELATAYVSLTSSAKGLGKSISDELDGPVGKAADDAGDRASKGFLGRFSSGLGGIGTVVAGAFAGVAVGGFLAGAIGEASSLGEATSKVGVVFGDSAQVINDFASSAATDIGLSRKAALEAAGTYGNLFRAIGLTSDVSAYMSTSLIGLAGDLSSFNDANPDDVLLALRAGLVGETEPLRQFGININDARLKAEAFRLGLVKADVDQDKFSAASETAEKAARKTAEALTKYGEDSVQYADAARDAEQANSKLAQVLEGKVPDSLDAATKAQASYSLIMADTALAQGDFARTSGSLANQGRSLSARFDDLKATVGTALLPAVTGVATVLATTVVPAFEKWVPLLADRLQPALAVVGEQLRERLLPAVQAVAARLREVDWAAVFAQAADFIRPVLAFVRQLVDAVSSVALRLREVDWAEVFGRAMAVVGPVAEGIEKLASALLTASTQALPPLRDAFTYLAFTVLPPILDKALAIAEVLGPILGGAIGALAPLVGFLGDHMDTLVPLLIGAAGAFAAFKTAMAIGSTISTVTTTISTLNGVASTFGVSFSRAALEAAKQSGPLTRVSESITRVKSAAISAGTAVLNYAKATIAWVKSAVTAIATAVKQAATWVAQKVALVATTIATKAAAAGQWLLNAAMSANPIGLIIAGLAALAAGLIYAYTHSETFRGIVDAIGRFFRDVLWPAIVDVAQAVGGFFVDAFNLARDVIGRVIDVVVDIARTVAGVFVDAFNMARDAIGFVIEVVQVVGDFIGRWIRVQIDAGVAAVRLLVDAFGWIIDKGREVYDLVSSSLDQLVGFVSGLADRVTSAASGMWDGIKDSFRGVINTLIGWWNNLSFELPSVDTKIPGIGTVGGFTIRTPGISPLADGGVITKPTLALMGEVGRARPEIASPVSLMRDTFNDVLAKRGTGPAMAIEHYHAGNASASEVARKLAWTLRTGGAG